MVGMVAADLGTAGGRVEPDRAVCTEFRRETIDQLAVTRTLLRDNFLIGTVQFGEGPIIQALGDLLLQLHRIRHNATHLSSLPFLLLVCTKRATLF